MSRTLRILLIAFVCFIWMRAAEPPAKQIDMKWGVRIPMRDGVHLNATVYTPHAQTTPLPVIFTLTPYIGDSYLERARYFSQNGYVYALVDVRGRGNSEGAFEPFTNEGRDGYDTVEWFAKQPWCNGKVAMWGGSYAGFDQWSTAKEFPPHLSTIVPAAAAHAAVDFPFFHNIFSSYVMQWLTFTSGVTGNTNTFGDFEFWTSKSTELYQNHIPFRELDRVVGNTTTVFQKWIAHPTPDAYWDGMAPTAADYKRFAIPILTITGDYDGDQTGAMTYYRRHMQYGTDSAKAQHFLIIGPWDHPGTRTPKKDVGGLTFGQASVLDLNDLHRQWYDWTMKSGAKPEFLKSRVAYFVAGADVWKYADSLEAIPATRRQLYLSGGSGPRQTVFDSGRLNQERPNGESSSVFEYDPLNISPAEREQKPAEAPLTDQTGAMRMENDGLIFHSPPLPADIDISGYVTFVAWIALDVPDTDLAVELDEVLANGQSVQLSSDLIRARYRESLTKETLVVPGKVSRYEFNGFTFFSRRAKKGSRLRLIVSCPNSIQLEKNYNSGKVVAEESAKDARKAHVTLHYGGDHASVLELPVETTSASAEAPPSTSK